MTQEQIVAQLEKATAKDAKSVYTSNQTLWNELGIKNANNLQNKCNANELSRNEQFLKIRNIVIITK